MDQVKIPEAVMVYFRLTGSLGGKERARKHSTEQLRAWGKLGGRPKGTGKNQKKSKGSK